MKLEDLPAVEAVTHRDVRVRGVRLHVAEAGDGPPLVLLHGWPQHWWVWRKLIPQLARTHRVLAPDLRGWGWSDAPAGDYRKDEYARDVLALLDAEGIERASVMGHDWGGYTGFLLALEQPSRVDRLVALDIAPPWPGPPRPRHIAVPLFGLYQVLLALPFVGPRSMTASDAFVRAILRGASASDMRWTAAEVAAYAGVLRDSARARASTRSYRTFLTRELPAALAGGGRSRELRVPSLLVMGERSPLRRALDPQPGPNLRVEQIAHAGHFLPEEAPREVLDLALPFLTATDDEPAAVRASSAGR